MRHRGHCHLSFLLPFSPFPLPSPSLPLRAVGYSAPGAGHLPAPRCPGLGAVAGATLAASIPPHPHPGCATSPAGPCWWSPAPRSCPGVCQQAALPNLRAVCFKARNQTAGGGGGKILKQPRAPMPAHVSPPGLSTTGSPPVSPSPALLLAAS